jgi:hypothetical protein
MFVGQHEIQEQELELIRKYEAALLAKEAEQLTEELDTNMAFSSSISALGKNPPEGAPGAGRRGHSGERGRA